MNEPIILFMSNGYGEDTIASRIIRSIRDNGAPCAIKALPLVGEGRAYRRDDVEMIGPCRLMPSGGMIPGNLKNLIGDFSSGLFRLTLDQIAAIREVRRHVILTVAVGDIYPVIFSYLFSRKPVVMVGTAKSNYFYHYNRAERMLMRASCAAVFPRDEITARALRESHIDARWMGNVMMDSLDITGEDFGFPKDCPCVAVLPGSRMDTYRDITVILDALEKLDEALSHRVSFIMAVADSIDLALLSARVSPSGWSFNEGAVSMGGPVIHHFVKKGITVLVTKDRFGDALIASRIVIGQAGTGNEQAAGLGRPVVTFESSGNEKMGWYRARQKGLLGDSISVVKRDSEAIAGETVAILNDAGRYAAMGKIGCERLGPPGAAQKIASYCIELAARQGSVQKC